MGLNRLQTIWRGVTLAVLLVVSLHTIAPIDLSVGPQSGSAFSAFTGDVALACREQTASQQKLRSDKPEPPVLVLPTRIALDSVSFNPDSEVCWQSPR